jgi:hypothetical protein
MMARKRKKNMIDTAAGEAVRALADAAVAVAKLRNDIPDRELIDGITKDGSTRGDGLVVLNDLLDKLALSGRVYAQHDDVMITNEANTKFKLLAVDGRAEQKAGAALMNIVAGVQYRPNPSTGEIESWEFRIPDSICDQLFAMDRCMVNLPAVTTYATHSVFDADFRLHGPGYHADQKILVQGLDVHPNVAALHSVPRSAARTVPEAVDRLPHHLRRLLKDFDWAGPVDLTNTLGTLLMGLLMNHFVEDGHPAIFIRGNQPSIGKSLLAKAIGMIFDGRRVAAIKKSGDEEFDKLMCAMLKKRRRMVFLDNLRNQLDSERIEQMITSPTLLIRILGTNDFGEWPNDVLFVLTSNNLVAGRDLVSRNLVIDLYTEGDPKKRQAARKASKPLAYAALHRAEILGELAAMVLRWVDAGQPDGDLNTRFDRVSQVVGGILDVNGFPGFASNAEAAAVEMDDELQRVLELAEEIVAGKHGAEVMVQRGADASKAGHVASQWVAVFERLGLIDVRQQQDATAKSKSSRVGKLFSSYIDRRLTVDSGSQRHSVTIRKRSGSSGNKTFYFAEVEVIEDAAGGQAEGEAQHQAAAAAACSAAEVTAGVADAYTPTASAVHPAAGRDETSTPAAGSPKGWLRAAAAAANATAPTELNNDQ